MIENGYFKLDDPKASEIMGYPISPGWWSRRYEYPWALEYAEKGQVVADMGCGWMYRPFKDALVDLGCQVYAVDGDERMLSQEKRPGLEFIVADITQEIQYITAGSLDRVFCISVLEDIDDKVPLALQEFSRCLKPGGLCVLTFDVQYDMEKPLGQYPGMNLIQFIVETDKAGLDSREIFKTTFGKIGKNGILHNEEFNLCAYHCILIKP